MEDENAYRESPLIGELSSAKLQLRQSGFQLVHERFFSEE
jgi:hypothetical protein